MRRWNTLARRYRGRDVPPYAAPASGALQNLPLTYLETAEYDPLRDEGRHYASALQSHGVEVVVNETRRTIHGYDSVAKSAITQDSLRQRIAFLKKAFNAAAH